MGSSQLLYKFIYATIDRNWPQKRNELTTKRGRFLHAFPLFDKYLYFMQLYLCADSEFSPILECPHMYLTIFNKKLNKYKFVYATYAKYNTLSIFKRFESITFDKNVKMCNNFICRLNWKILMKRDFNPY